MPFALLLALAVSADPVPTGPPAPRAAGWDGWCPKLYHPVAPGVCLAGTASTFEPGHLIVYFHGMVEKPPYANPELTTVAAQAVKRHFAVLALQGQVGLCNWSPNETWSCWPTDKSQLPDVAQQLARVTDAMTAASGDLKRAVGPPLVMGFSNGGFFTTMIATETKLDVAAYAVLHAGPVTGQSFPPARRRPMLLVMAHNDDAQFPRMVVLADALAAAGWAPTIVTRDGYHEVRDDDVGAALDFFDAQLRPNHHPEPKAERGPFKVVPPVSGTSP